MTAKPDGAKNERAHRRAQELISAYVDDDLTQPEKERFESHLAECAQCVRDVETLRQTVEWLGQMPDQPLPRSFMIPESEARRSAFAFDWLFPYFRAGAIAAACLLVFVLSADLFRATLSTARLAQAPMYMEQAVKATVAPTSVTALQSAAPPAVRTGETEMNDLPPEEPGTAQEETEGLADSVEMMESRVPLGAEVPGEAASLEPLVYDHAGETVAEAGIVAQPAPPLAEAEKESAGDGSQMATAPDADLAPSLALGQEPPDRFSADVPLPYEEVPQEPAEEAKSAAPRPQDLTSVPLDRAAPAAPAAAVPLAIPEEGPADEAGQTLTPAPTLLATFVYTAPKSGIMSSTAPTDELAWAQLTPPAMPTPPPRAKQQEATARHEGSYGLIWRATELSLLLVLLVCAAGAWVIARQRSGTD